MFLEECRGSNATTIVVLLGGQDRTLASCGERLALMAGLLEHAESWRRYDPGGSR